jgi:transposase
MAVEEATTSEVFEAYAKHFLAPTLRPGLVVVLDNLEAHRPKRVSKIDRGAGLRAHLPAALLAGPQSPIE